jgi:hypothetical protein
VRGVAGLIEVRWVYGRRTGGTHYSGFIAPRSGRKLLCCGAHSTCTALRHATSLNGCICEAHAPGTRAPVEAHASYAPGGAAKPARDDGGAKVFFGSADTVASWRRCTRATDVVKPGAQKAHTSVLPEFNSAQACQSQRQRPVPGARMSYQYAPQAGPQQDSLGFPEA